MWHKAGSENASQRQVTVRGSFPAKLCLLYQINNVPSNKCKCPWLGSWRGRSDLPVAIDWPCDMIKVLGIFIGFGDIDAANWNPRIDAVSKVLTSWKMRSLSYNGRAIVTNALTLSRICYVQCVPCAYAQLDARLVKET